MERIGESYTAIRVSFKPFASCAYRHPAINGVIYLRNQNRLEPQDVKTIHCGVSTRCMNAVCQRDHQTGLEGKFTIPYCGAVAFVKGRVGKYLFGGRIYEE